MRRPVRSRVIVCLTSVLVTSALGVVAAPNAVAGTEQSAARPSERLLEHLRTTSSAVPDRSDDVPALGRKL